MKVDHVLILAAGKGTRMGEIGKKVPKVLWPIGEKSLIDLEIEYAKSLVGEVDIYINVFNYKNILLEHFENNKKVNLIVENEMLDIGGAVHNLAAKIGYKGNLLIINSDQFIFMNKEKIQEIIEKLSHCSGILFGHEVQKKQNYNALSLRDNNILDDIIPHKNVKIEKYLTYTGMSIIKLEDLDRVQGESKYFDSVANYKLRDLKVEDVSDHEYWDFGTFKQYYDNVFKLRSSKNSDFYNFLCENLLDFEEAINKTPIKFKEFIIDKNFIQYEGIKTQC